MKPAKKENKEGERRDSTLPLVPIGKWMKDPTGDMIVRLATEVQKDKAKHERKAEAKARQQARKLAREQKKNKKRIVAEDLHDDDVLKLGEEEEVESVESVDIFELTKLLSPKKSTKPREGVASPRVATVAAAGKAKDTSSHLDRRIVQREVAEVAGDDDGGLDRGIQAASNIEFWHDDNSTQSGAGVTSTAHSRMAQHMSTNQAASQGKRESLPDSVALAIESSLMQRNSGDQPEEIII